MILAVNCGSSSLKYTLFDWDKYSVISTGSAEKVGTELCFINHKVNGEKKKVECGLANHEDALRKILELIEADGIKKEDISVVAHRFVHGGEKYRASQFVSEDDLKELEKLNPLAPLHNPANILGIRSVMKAMPWAKNTISLDTAFHEALPQRAYMYALPYEWYEKYGVRRYGFHGSSYLYTSRRIAKILGKKPQETNIVVCHLGSGASLCAIQNGVSIDTSMGFSPLEGVVMGTRSGDFDPAIIPYMERNGVSLKEQEEAIFSKKSGLIGMCGFNDMRDIEANLKENSKCEMAFDVMTYRVAKYIASYFGILPTVDAIVFTAGLGENSSIVREEVIRKVANLGIKLDTELNDKNVRLGVEDKISSNDSRIPVYVIPTDEEIVLIEDAKALIDGAYKSPANFYHYRFEEK